MAPKSANVLSCKFNTDRTRKFCGAASGVACLFFFGGGGYVPPVLCRGKLLDRTWDRTSDSTRGRLVPFCEQTDMSENITFSILRMGAVKIPEA